MHRDLTPMNVFVCDGRRLRLGDFGIARHATARFGVQADVFNAWFANPKIAANIKRHWTAVDDVWQVGQLVAALVTGEAEEPITTHDVKALPGSAELHAVVRAAIGDGNERFHDAGEMLLALESTSSIATPGLRSLKGKTVVFTGPLSVTRTAAKGLVRRAGGKTAESVTAKTDVLVKGRVAPNWSLQTRGIKLLEAEGLRRHGHVIAIIGERSFMRLVDQ